MFCVSVHVYVCVPPSVFKVHGAGRLQRVCQQLQHCDGSGEEDVRLQTGLPGLPQGI